MAFANLFRGFFKQHAIAARYGGARQICILIITAAKQTKEFALLFLLLVG